MGVVALQGLPRNHFAVVTDSAADITPQLADELRVHVVPLNVTIGGETLADGALSQAEFFRRMSAAESLPTTSQPSPAALEETYRQALETADSVVALHVSSKLSGTLETARSVAQSFEGRVHVWDSLNLSWGLGWQVLDAAHAAREGLTVQDALSSIARTRDRVRIVVTLDSLENLRRGGRIGAVSSFVGSILNLKVTVAVDAEGAFTPLRGNRGNKAALDYMTDWIAKQMGTATAGRFAVGHAMSEELASGLADRIRQRWNATELVMYEAGSVISAHAGTIWGVAFCPED